MSAVCIEKLPHTCGTRSGLQVFLNDDETISGYCFSCNKYIPNPYGNKKVDLKDLPKPIEKTEEEIREEISMVERLKSLNVPQKKLRSHTLEHFGVKVGVSEEDGKTPNLLFYPAYSDGELTGYKVKSLNPKAYWSVGLTKNLDFFGWQQAMEIGPRKLIVTEGEDDAIALTRVIEMYENKDYAGSVAVVSLPFGAGSAPKLFQKHKKDLDNIRQVVLCFDMDKVGREAVKEVQKIYPKAISIDIPAKDANECVLKGRSKQLFNCLFPKKAKTSRLVRGGDIWEEAAVPAKWGELSWPWPHIDEVTRGIRYGETIYIGAGVKMGKSEVVNALAAHFIMKHNVPVLLAKPEEDNKSTIKRIAGKAVGQIFHDPKIPFDDKEFQKAKKLLDPDNKVFLLDLWQHMGWETLKDDIYEAVSHGVKAVFIDPITNLTVGMDSGEANTKLEQIASECSIMAKDLNIVVFIFCHLKAHEGTIARESREKKYKSGIYIGLGNCPHEYGGDIYSNQFAGSRAMMRSCNLMVGLEGNKDPELPPEISNVRHLKILEDREYGSTGIFKLRWNEQTQLFGEF